MQDSHPPAKNGMQSKLIDESLEESFPASDAPAWSVVKKSSKPEKPEHLQQSISLRWKLNTTDFTYENYNRDATIQFSGGDHLELSNPEMFGGDSRYVNSEEMLLGALSFCYMQTFLAIASKNHYTVKAYQDHAVGTLGKNAEDKMCVTGIQLNPEVTFENPSQITEAVLERLKESAHRHCFIANSLSTEVKIHIKSM